MPYPYALYLAVIEVSIHAPRCRGAMLIPGYEAGGLVKFQSTPPVAGGRCA